MYKFTYQKQSFYVYGKTIRECEEKAAEKKIALSEHMHIDKFKITFSKIYDEWLAERPGTVKQSTIYDNERCYKRLPKWFTSLKIIDIQRSDIIKLQNQLLKTLTTSGVKHTLSVVNMVMDHAIKDRIINFNPCSTINNLKRTEKEASETIHRALTEEEQKQFFEYAKNTYYYNLFAFLISSGCRLGEAAALQWSDVDLFNNVIHINKTVSRVSDNRFIISDTPKTKSSIRDIPLTESIKGILKDQNRQNEDLSILCFDNRIFPGINGNIVNSAIISTCLKHIFQRMEKNNIHFKKFSAHGFRATFATRCIEQGMNPQTLKTILGHANLSMTMDLYAHVLPNTKAEEMGKMKIVI